MTDEEKILFYAKLASSAAMLVSQLVEVSGKESVTQAQRDKINRKQQQVDALWASLAPSGGGTSSGN